MVWIFAVVAVGFIGHGAQEGAGKGVKSCSKGKTENGGPRLGEGKEQSDSVLLFGSRLGKEKLLNLFIRQSREMLPWQRFESWLGARVGAKLGVWSPSSGTLGSPCLKFQVMFGSHSA